MNLEDTLRQWVAEYRSTFPEWRKACEAAADDDCDYKLRLYDEALNEELEVLRDIVLDWFPDC